MKGGIVTDFVRIVCRKIRGVNTIYPDFTICNSKDLMVKGHAFYAIWDKANNRWSTDEFDAARLIDEELEAKRLELADTFQDNLNVRYMRSFSSGSWNDFKNYLSKMPDSAKVLDNKIIFENTETKQTDYASKSLPYACQKGDFSAWDKLIRTLYSPDERQKIEWAIGSIVDGDSKTIQKFLAFYGEPGSGKSTILNIIQMLFDGYYVVFDAKSLTSSNNQFSTEAFRSNPLVAIQHDGDLSHIEDNSKLNSIVSHEYMLINEKYKPSYTSKFNCFLFLASNKPVKISDSKSGVIRRLIDVTPTGKRLSFDEYNILMNRVEFELGAIAYHCLEVYRSLGKHYYDSYRPIGMMYQTDVFFNFVSDHLDEFKSEDGISLTRAYSLYKQYCDEALIQFKMPQYKFRDELTDYFTNFERSTTVDGRLVKNYYSGFISDKFKQVRKKEEERTISLNLDYTTSIFDKEAKNYPAQYANEDDKPIKRWLDVRTKLSDLDTSKVHYVKLPSNHIVIDFDLRDADGNKSAELNLEAASKWPPTYAEFSKGGAGVHLHYIYDFDPKGLSRIYDEGIEIKVFTGNSSLRRRLTKCNNLPIAHISTGLPKKEVKQVLNEKTVEDEKMLRNVIKKALRKEVHPDTSSNVDFINAMLEKYYDSGVVYDVTDMRPAILAFAAQSTNQSERCIALVNKMRFKSETRNENVDTSAGDDPLVFYDVECFPNLFIICWKYDGEEKDCVKMINPKPSEVEQLFRFKLVGFNNRKYDNHMIYARYLGYNNEQLYQLSRRLTDNDQKESFKNCFFSEAYNLSYTDVYDFASAGNKKSLKKWEIELGIHHQELGFPWDKPLPEDKWALAAEYCCNDVKATEVVFHHLEGDWIARQILAKLSGLTVNDTTNQHTYHYLFGSNKHPTLIYTDLSTGKQYEGAGGT